MDIPKRKFEKMEITTKYHLRHSEKEIKDKKEIEKIIRNGKYATLALSKDNNPYVLTLSYGYDFKNGTFYFHTAKKGMKIDFINANKKASLTVVEDLGYVQNECEHRFKSIVAFGDIEIVESYDEKIFALNVMFEHLEKKPDEMRKKHFENRQKIENVCMLKMKSKQLTAKESR